MLPRRHLPRLAATVVSVALLATLAPAGPAAASALPEVPSRPVDLAHVREWPQQNALPVWPDNPADASIPIGVLPYDEIAPKLNALQRASDRVSARVAGKSAGGYDLYAVTVTAPETRTEARRQEAWKRLIEDEPVRARQDRDLLAHYKTPLFVNANIHGNEWEGTDAALRVIEDLATSTSPEVAELLERNRLVFNVTANPDGRVAGTRANGNGYDLNRDLTIVAQPETALIRDLIVDTKPIITLDLHGYVSPTLLHPSTPPHNVNNEYDLFIKHALPNALAIEQDLRGLGYAETQRARIPFRDDAPGVWDDFPPIYVPSFALLQSSIPYTIEAPLNPRGGNLTPAERVRRSGINTDVHEVAIRTSLRYIQEHRTEVLHDQAEVYRRGWAGEPLRDVPDGFVPGWGPEDDYRTTFPRAYVIPTGAGQRSGPAAARLVDLLIDSGGRVWRAKQAFTADGKRYPAGSYVIDLHQPKRGLVNSLLEPGADITDRVNDLYAGPAAWSQGLTWGATVDTLWDTLPDVKLERTWDGQAEGDLPAGRADLRLDLRDAADLRTVNKLLDAGVAVYRLADGSVVVPGTPANRKLARAEVRAQGVTFTDAPDGWRGTPLDRVVVGYLGTVEERDTLAELGFPTRAVTAATLAGTLTDDVDVLLVAGNLNLANLTVENRAALDRFLARGGGVVGLGTPGASFGNASGLLSVTATAAPGLASGVANIVNQGGPVTGSAIPHAFVSQPVWFTNLGAGVEVEQTYAADPLLAGWWATGGVNGQLAAAGQASIVRTVSPAGNGVVLFGTDPTFRLHPKGLQPQLGRAVLWAARR
ncbi:M14 family zinc carboxypeptidase [Micromonospora cathayae]|uniref:M14 family zinc carboxypeptidase n=1 Tax=Micromonospora cathayae TaxID=3028804 RepID=A0ABY7ZR57_9ACTN|nr:M14 family zinc carboxypeptidase [Micromonospora sp. HUAS 3]WDZ84548.1 M14 family zinc carboxypeptidase [Micromonospora sp. HUAS 3]